MMGSSLVLRIAHPLHGDSEIVVWDKGDEVCDTNIYTRLEKQGRDLAAVVCLMVEKMLQDCAEILV